MATGLIAGACGAGDLPTETTDFHHSPFLCELTTVIRNQQGTITGTVEGIESPLEGLPNGYPGRTHALVDVNVTQVVGLHRDRVEVGNDVPDILPGSTVRLVVYHDNLGIPFDSIELLQRSGEEALFILAALGDAANPEWEGVWGVRRVVELSDGRAIFRGACAEELNPALANLAAKLGRPADLSLVADFAAEGLARYDNLADHGPIEQTARGET